MAQTYIYCNNCTGATQTVSADLTSVAPYTVVEGWDGGARFVRLRYCDITFTIPSAINCDITFNYTVVTTSIYYGGSPAFITNTYTGVIPEGATTVTYRSCL